MGERWINLETGEVQELDIYKVKQYGRLDGFVAVDEVTTDMWIEALQRSIREGSWNV